MNTSARTPTDAATLLVVDDEEMVRHFMERVLLRAGYKVLVAKSGFDALELLRAKEQTVHLVLTDLIMPAMRGEELAAEIARLPSPPPILFVSASDVPPGGAAAKYLQKPFTADGLTRAVEQALSTEKADTSQP